MTGGQLVLNGAAAGPTQTYAAGHALEAKATFSGATFQHVGFGVDFNTQPYWAMFSIKGDGHLYARTNNNNAVTETQLSDSLIGSAHVFRVEWTATEVRYYVDGSLVATHTASIAVQMRPLASDLFNGDAGTVSVDWLRMSPYPGSGTFTSRVFDGTQTVNWKGLNWTAASPAGTGIALSVRTGDTPTPDGSWTSFAPVSGPGAQINASSRYLQYQAVLTSSDPNQTPTLNDVSIGYVAPPDTTAPTISQRTPSPNAVNVAPNGNVQVQFSEPMNPATIDGSTIRLRKQGAGSDVPASVTYSGNTATLDPSADLDFNSVYTVTVAGTVADQSGNQLGADDTWSFTTAPHTFGFTDTTVGDFGGGSPDANTYISETGNGELTLKPTEGQEFSGGPGLPAGWDSSNWDGGGSATVSSGQLRVNGSRASTTATYPAGRSLEFVATFNAATFQHVGFTSDNFASDIYAIFSTGNTTDQIRARTNFGGGEQSFTIPGLSPGTPHLYRIEWDAGEVRYYVDGALVATHTGSFGPNLRPTVSDGSSAAPELSVDWLRMSPYPASGTFDSRVFDAGAGQSVNWGALTWSSATPSGTDLAMSVRTGNTPTPDGSWSDFAPIGSSGGDIPGTSRFVQYRAVLNSSDSTKTPALNDVTVNGTEDAPPVAVNDTKTVAENSGATPIDVLANDTNPDGGPKQIDSVTQPAHGTVAITGGGTGLTYQPNANYCNDGNPTDDFTYTLNGGSTATVAVSVSCVVDNPPVAVNDTKTVTEDTSPALLTNRDFEVDTSGWGSSNAAISRSTAEQHGGAASMQVDLNGTTWAQAFTNPYTAADPNTAYTVGMWVKAPLGYHYSFGAVALDASNDLHKHFHRAG